MSRSIRETPTVIAIALRTVRKTLDDHGKDGAAAIAYYAFFSIFPLLLGLLAVAGFFFESARIQASIREIATEALPGSAEFVSDNVAAVVRNRETLGAISILALFWSASAAFGAISRAINVAWGFEHRRALLARVRFFVMTLGAILLVLASSAISWLIELLDGLEIEALDEILASSLGSRITGWSTSFAFMLLTFLMIYKTAPYRRVRWRQVWPGALLAAVLFEVGKVVFAIYLDRMADFASIYGPLSSIIVMLLWLYCSALALILGAELNVVLDERARGSSPKS